MRRRPNAAVGDWPSYNDSDLAAVLAVDQINARMSGT
jgi:hypothetical protein